MDKFLIKKLKTEETELFSELITLFQEVFEDERPGNVTIDYLKKLLSNDSVVVFVALIGDELVGGLTAHKMPSYYIESPELFIYDVAIQEKFQRRGIGSLLIDKVLKYGEDMEVKEIFVDADNEDLHALKFYQATGAKKAGVSQFTYYL